MYKLRFNIKWPVLFVAWFFLTQFPAAATGKDRILTDPLGRTVSVPEDPRRVVSLAPSITEMIYALEQGYRLKGVTRFSNYPLPAKNLPRVGSYIHLDLERIVALKPDLCLAVKDGNPKEVAQRLESLNIPVYAVDPRNMNELLHSIVAIGDVLNANTRAQSLVVDMQARIDRVKALVANTDRAPRVFLQIGTTPIVSVGSKTYIHELIEMAGGINLAQGPTAYPRLSQEQVLVLAPEIMIITSMTRGEVFEKVKAEWSQWPDIPAVKHQRIHLVDSDLLDRPSPRLIDGLELLVKLIHPELFGNKQ